MDCIRKISEGHYVENLEDIREECNNNLISKYPDFNFLEFSPKDFPVFCLLSSIAFVENNSLMDKAIGFYEEQDNLFSSNFRKEFLELLVQSYFPEQ